MKRRPKKQEPTNRFEIVRAVGLALPDVEATTKYDGSPVLKLNGCFMAGLATHPSAEPDTLVVRVGCEEREWLIEDAPDTYYLTDYYRSYPLLLVAPSPASTHDAALRAWQFGFAARVVYPQVKCSSKTEYLTSMMNVEGRSRTMERLT